MRIIIVGGGKLALLFDKNPAALSSYHLGGGTIKRSQRTDRYRF